MLIDLQLYCSLHIVMQNLNAKSQQGTRKIVEWCIKPTDRIARSTCLRGRQAKSAR